MPISSNEDGEKHEREMEKWGRNARDRIPQSGCLRFLTEGGYDDHPHQTPRLMHSRLDTHAALCSAGKGQPARTAAARYTQVEAERTASLGRKLTPMYHTA